MRKENVALKMQEEGIIAVVRTETAKKPAK